MDDAARRKQIAERHEKAELDEEDKAGAVQPPRSQTNGQQAADDLDRDRRDDGNLAFQSLHQSNRMLIQQTMTGRAE